jgi:hypothetical protein
MSLTNQSGGTLVEMITKRSPRQQLPWLRVVQHQQTSLRVHATCRLLGFPMPAPAVMAPGSPNSNTSRPQGHHYLVGIRQFNLPAPLPHGNPQLATQCQEPATTHPSDPHALGFTIFWHQKASFPTEHRGPALPTVSESKRALALLPKIKNARFPTEGRKAGTLRAAPEALFLQGTQTPCTSCCAFLQKSHIFPVQGSGKSATLLAPGDLCPTMHRPNTPH